MIKILHLQTEINLACGVTRTISQIIKNSSTNFEHHLIAIGGDGVKRFNNFGFSPQIINLNKDSFYGTIKILYRIFKYCKKNSIQIIHCHHRYFDSIIWILKSLLKIKTITSVQSKVSGKKTFSYKAEILIACSKAIKNHLINNFQINENRIRVIYNAVELKSILNTKEKNQIAKEIGIKVDKHIIGFVGRIDFAEKGVDILLEAFNQLSNSNPSVHLLLVGDGPNNQEVKKYYDLKKENTTLLSAKENIFDYYNLMDVIVLPSRVDPFPLAMLETGLMSKPFIGSNVDGIPEIIIDGHNGLLFESENVEELKNQILKVINDKELSEKLAKNLNRTVLESYTTDKILPKYKEVYLDVLRQL
ncbi:MAG: glycosyltransferase family 4 protein [Ignavibacteriota bacterium]